MKTKLIWLLIAALSTAVQWDIATAQDLIDPKICETDDLSQGDQDFCRGIEGLSGRDLLKMRSLYTLRQTNRPPVARLERVKLGSGDLSLFGRIDLDATASTDQDGYISSYTFWLQNAETAELLAGPVTRSKAAVSFSLTRPLPAKLQAILRVQDDEGASHTAEIRFSPGLAQTSCSSPFFNCVTDSYGQTICSPTPSNLRFSTDDVLDAAQRCDETITKQTLILLEAAGASGGNGSSQGSSGGHFGYGGLAFSGTSLADLDTKYPGAAFCYGIGQGGSHNNGPGAGGASTLLRNCAQAQQTKSTGVLVVAGGGGGGGIGQLFEPAGNGGSGAGIIASETGPAYGCGGGGGQGGGTGGACNNNCNEEQACGGWSYDSKAYGNNGIGGSGSGHLSPGFKQGNPLVVAPNGNGGSTANVAGGGGGGGYGGGGAALDMRSGGGAGGAFAAASTRPVTHFAADGSGGDGWLSFIFNSIHMTGKSAASSEGETIYASKAAGTSMLRLLRAAGFRVAPLVESASQGHLVAGPSDLSDPSVLTGLRAAHRAGRIVAMTDATEREALHFHRQIYPGQELDCRASDPSGGKIAFYGLQRTQTPAREISYCLPTLSESDPGSDRQWLRESFAPAARGLEDADPDELTKLASAKTCSFKKTVDGIGDLSWVIDIWAMRDFSDTQFCENTAKGCDNNKGSDYYLAFFNPTLTPKASNANQFFVEARRLKEAATQKSLATDYMLITDLDPNTTTSYVSSYSTSKSKEVNGSVGFSKDGPNVTVGGSVSVSSGQDITIPPVIIHNSSDTKNAEPSWSFVPQSVQVNNSYSPGTGWLWIVGRDAYPGGGTGTGQVSFSAGANIFTTSTNTDEYSTCNVQYPFTTWTIEGPKLTKLDPPSVKGNGGRFTITGTSLYPDSVTSVLIGGNPVSLQDNVTLTDAQHITVTVPGTSNFSPGTYEVEVHTKFDGQDQPPSNQLELTITD